MVGESGNMNEESVEQAIGNESSILRCKISNLQFPEICPVCMKEGEDLIAVTVIERSPSKERYDTHSSWGSGEDKVGAALEAARGATVFWIPTCLKHGSRSVRTERKRLLAFAAYFVMFYPMLYFFLSLRNAMLQERPFEIPLLGLLVTLLIFLLMAFYGFYPRSLEKAVTILNTERSRDSVYLRIRNDEYRRAFMELNEMSCDFVSSVAATQAQEEDPSEFKRQTSIEGYGIDVSSGVADEE
ncbi:MAG: hypothetical protein EAX81_00550 [Candidatus Thorarchaeota archaeon]|nr:hypothetical protein [Candidatus Thorarchaeota archaeon]